MDLILNLRKVWTFAKADKIEVKKVTALLAIHDDAKTLYGIYCKLLFLHLILNRPWNSAS